MSALRNTSAWKAPGPDLLPAGFLRACGPPLTKALTSIAEASLWLEHFPHQLQASRVVVIPKPGKTVQQRQVVGVYRPIVLLNALGKVIETVMSRCIRDAAESQGLLPETQMGNRPHRSTELAVKLAVDATHTAWQYRAVVSLL